MGCPGMKCSATSALAAPFPHIAALSSPSRELHQLAFMMSHACESCGAEFQRSEHLSRHQLRHLGQRPFACTKCKLTFSRRDTLQRHVSVHDEEHENQPVPGTSQRVKRACRKCSQSKLRCDGNYPCSRCSTKNYTCWYTPSKSSKQANAPQVRELRPQTMGQGSNTLSSNQTDPAFQHSQPVEQDGGKSSSLYTSTTTGACAQSDLIASTQSDLIASTNTLGQISIPPPSLSAASHHEGMQFDGFVMQTTAQGLQYSDSYPFSISAQDVDFWGDPQCFDHLYQGPYTELHLPVPPEQEQMLPTEMSLSEPELDQSLLDLAAPVPSFLDARLSPEPQEGQDLRFNDFLRKTWATRRYLRSPAQSENAAAPDPMSMRYNARSKHRQQSSHMGSFPPALATEAGDSKWELEILALVPPLPKETYDRIVFEFQKVNDTNDHYLQFATGNFPSLVACNAFMELFFEEFNSLFPILHQPTFDPENEPLLLVIAVIATGCRFSKISAAVESADLLQEFVRRVFFATIERDYGSTFEPWLVQAGLLCQIGMQFSNDIRLVESAQSMRSLLASLCRKINCFRESYRSPRSASQQSPAETWRFWARKESMRRLAYTLWLVDSQYELFFDLPPILPTDLLRVSMPCFESLWRAPTAFAWIELSKNQSLYSPLSIRRELNHLYRTKARRQGLGEFTILLLVMGVFRGALQCRRSAQEGIYATPNSVLQVGPESGPLPETFPGTRAAMDYLHILCSDVEDWSNSRKSSLKSTILHHYHAIGILLGIPLGELFCFLGYRVTSVDIFHCQNRLRVWVRERSQEARQVAYYAGRVFGDIRNSNMHGYHEGRAMMVACISLWIYGEIAEVIPDLNNENRMDLIQTIRLDQHVDRQAEQDWVQNGAGIRPYLAGVGCVLGADGVSRVIQEASRVLCASKTWSFCGVMGKSLEIFHALRSKTTTREALQY